MKIHDHYEFPVKLDLDQFLSPDGDHSVRNVYELHSVLVHSVRYCRQLICEE